MMINGKNQAQDAKSMKKKTILLLGQDDLLSRFVEQMLSEQADWEVVFVSMEQNTEAIYSVLENLSPDVVISQHGNAPRTSRALSILFRVNPKLKLINITLKSNMMEIYSKQNILIQSAADLISAIEA